MLVALAAAEEIELDAAVEANPVVAAGLDATVVVLDVLAFVAAELCAPEEVYGTEFEDGTGEAKIAEVDEKLGVVTAEEVTVELENWIVWPDGTMLAGAEDDIELVELLLVSAMTKVL